MFGRKKLQHQRDEWEKLARQLEADLNASKDARAKLGQHLDRASDEIEHQSREYRHLMDKYSLAMRALNAERHLDVLNKHVLDSRLVQPLGLVVPKADIDKPLTPPQQSQSGE